MKAPESYGPRFAALLTPRLPVLGHGSADESVRPKLAALTAENAFEGHHLVNRSAAACCISALWLWHDFLDESHRISQDIDTIEGSFWHAIMHRREPDYGNAKYWFRRVPKHPIYAPLAAAAREFAQSQPLDPPTQFLLQQNAWDALRFVDLCEAIALGQSKCEDLARRIAVVEWQLLFDHCFRQAIG